MTTPHTPLELWGGVECTINRVGDRFFDQLEIAGHRRRVVTDLQLFADLGLHTLRTALNWEHFKATGSWESFDLLLATMQTFGLHPIAGLLHHGSGPPSTSLVDPRFPEKLATYALAVATRYPHLRDYTPVNEPHTTARFSGLYGHWFPHGRSLKIYIRALFNELKATVLAMRAIRTIRPDAQLIYTEDGGRFFSTPELHLFREQREHRRWLGTDLLCGLVTPQHPLFPFLLEHDVAAAEILWFAENPCPPSILGLNYYVTSDRFLDHRLHLYPPHLAGGDSGSEPLVDFEAVRVRPEGIAGVRSLLTEAWDRYRIPVAITEAHLGADSEQQIQWLSEIWQGAQAAKHAGADVRAVTVWALLGSSNWCHLCTDDSGIYELGVFDVSSGEPRATPLAALVAQLARGAAPSQKSSATKGWWNKRSRLTTPPPHPGQVEEDTPILVG